MKRHLQCAEQQVSRSNLTKYCACHAERLAYLVLITYETSFTVRGATGVTIEPHQILRLPRKIALRNFWQNLWKQVKRHFQCGDDPRMIREWSDHDPRMIRPWKRKPQPASQVRLLFELPRSIFYCKIQRFAPNLTFKPSPSAAPATKSDTWTSPSTAPATKSDTWPSPSTAPATKSSTGTSPSTAPATKSDIWTSPSTAPVTKSNTPSTAPATKNDTLLLLYCTRPYWTLLLYSTLLNYCTVTELYSTLLYSTLLYCKWTLLHSTVLYTTLLYWTLLNSTIQYCTELWLCWTVTLLNCDSTELWLRWTVTLLNCDFTELWLYFTVTLLNCDFTLLWLYWTVTLLYCDFTELTLLHCYFTLLNCNFTEMSFVYRKFLNLNFLWLYVKIRSIMYAKASHHVTSDFPVDVRTLHLSNAMPINKIALSWKTSISNGVRTGALHFSASCCWRMEPLSALSVNCFPESIRCWQWQQAPAQNDNQKV